MSTSVSSAFERHFEHQIDEIEDFEPNLDSTKGG
jgi:hypothetical protein